MIKNLLLCLSLIGSFINGEAQNFSNKGKDFWVGYGYHQVMINNNSQDMVLYFATDQITTVTVSIPGLAYSQTYANIPAIQYLQPQYCQNQDLAMQDCF